MIKIALVDNDPEFSLKIEEFIHRFSKETQVECEILKYDSGINFSSDYFPIFDIVLLNVALPFISGIEVARRLRKIDGKVPIIFLSESSKMAIQGYEVNALGFILKSVGYINFSKTLKRALSYIESNEGHFLILRSQIGVQKLSIRDIKYIEVMNHSLIYHTTQGIVQMRGVLNQLEEELKLHNFIRCNHCFLVNLRYVSGFTQTSIMINGIKLAISRRKKNIVIEQLTRYFDEIEKRGDVKIPLTTV